VWKGVREKLVQGKKEREGKDYLAGKGGGKPGRGGSD